MSNLRLFRTSGSHTEIPAPTCTRVARVLNLINDDRFTHEDGKRLLSFLVSEEAFTLSSSVTRSSIERCIVSRRIRQIDVAIDQMLLATNPSTETKLQKMQLEEERRDLRKRVDNALVSVSKRLKTIGAYLLCTTVNRVRRYCIAFDDSSVQNALEGQRAKRRIADRNIRLLNTISTLV